MQVRVTTMASGRKSVQSLSGWREYNPYLKTGDGAQTKDGGTVARHFLIERLEPGTTYEVRIQARTVLGVSPESRHTFTTKYVSNKELHVTGSLSKSVAALKHSMTVFLLQLIGSQLSIWRLV